MSINGWKIAGICIGVAFGASALTTAVCYNVSKCRVLLKSPKSSKKSTKKTHKK